MGSRIAGTGRMERKRLMLTTAHESNGNTRQAARRGAASIQAGCLNTRGERRGGGGRKASAADYKEEELEIARVVYKTGGSDG